MKSARITWSFARGTPRNDSDLDIRLNEKDLQALKMFLRANKREFDSEVPGHITVDGVEFFTCFEKQKRLPHDRVVINGAEFKTY